MRAQSTIVATALGVLHRARSSGRSMARRLKAGSLASKSASAGVNNIASLDGSFGSVGKAAALRMRQPPRIAGAKSVAAMCLRARRLVICSLMSLFSATDKRRRSPARFGVRKTLPCFADCYHFSESCDDLMIGGALLTGQKANGE